MMFASYRRSAAWIAIAFFAAVGFLLAFAVSASAGGRVCRSTGRCYVAPIVHHGSHHHETHHDDYRHFVGESLRDEAIAEKAALKILRTQYQIELDRLKNAATGGESPAQAYEQPAKLTKPVGAGDAPNWAKCISCHSGAKKERMNLSDAARLKLDCEDKMDILRKIRSGEMPKNGSLTDAEYEAFVDWCLR